jgi:flagellar hook protein FlgE
MFTAFSTALSALNATATAIDVVGNNLANLNTPGYKNSVVYFRDLVSQSMGGGSGESQVGIGIARPLTIRQFTQGAIQSSTGFMDAAVQGDGFFVTKGSQGNQLYTRAGNFQLDASGNMLSATGERVQGWTNIDPATGILDTNGAINDIVVQVGNAKQPVASNKFTLDLNLDSTAAADVTSKFSAPIKVYDTLGTSHVLTVHLQKTAAGQWAYNVTMPGEEITGGTTGTPFDLTGASGTLTFGTDGQLTAPVAGSPIGFDIPGLTSGAADMHLDWNPYTATGSGRITQFGQPSASAASSQNGSAASQLIGVALADHGVVLAQYSDGQQVAVAQLAMASVRNPGSLIASGNNNYMTSAHTATPAIGIPGTGGRGDIVAGAIESSTVDIAKAFTDLIVFQRSYQANSKVITTVDELSQVTINLKQ